MNFKEHYYTEARLMGHAVASRVEEAFVEVINTGRTKYTTMLPVVSAVVDKIGLEGTATWVGRTKTAKIDDTFVNKLKQIKPDLNVKRDIMTVPKTDFVVNDNKISLKLNRGWLFAHQTNEAQACTELLIEKDEALKTKLTNLVQQLFIDVRKFGGTELENAYVIKDQLIKNLVSEIFDEDFKTLFIQNALTGEFKFGHDNIATANKMLVVRFKDKSEKADTALRDIERIRLDKTQIYDLATDIEYMRHLAQTSRVSFVVQRTGKVRMDVNSVNYTDQLLAEGFVESLLDLLKHGYENVKDKIRLLLDKIIEIIEYSVNQFFQVLGISVKPEFINEIEF